MKLLDEAKYFAKNKHGKQMYGNKPYFYHLEQVSNLVSELGYDEYYQIIAILHDVVEDTETGWAEISHYFGNFVGDNVHALTHYETETYDEYISRVSRHSVAKVIKICDIICNLKESILGNKTQLIKKYQKALVDISK
ncbi:MAG: HD domain-containing protein [Microgenomates group bacterium]